MSEEWNLSVGDLSEVADELREAAVWLDARAFWPEERARHPNDDPTVRTVGFDVVTLDTFQTRLKTVASAWERMSRAVRSTPMLRLLQAGQA
jgi:hypothetical protein